MDDVTGDKVEALAARRAVAEEEPSWAAVASHPMMGKWAVPHEKEMAFSLILISPLSLSVSVSHSSTVATLNSSFSPSFNPSLTRLSRALSLSLIPPLI